MANAVKRFENKKVERVVIETVKEPAGVALVLSDDEARILTRLLGHHVVGPMKGPRGALDGIFQALYGLYGHTKPFDVDSERGFTSLLVIKAE
ncbi:hypothetical protein [Ralstonia phage P-PSG-11-1]|uniref:Uncharacterized protein n=1 Tax=Ralstonia phage P-PSG-11 TaxID=2652430 RepID=A0A5P8D6R9_9CAUD|nr:hypothetical protein [Ralstonia phage P-PSG-11]QFP93748.1 hypothetical protein [Ralstonia phage P-PSG-11-1]